MGAIVVGGVGLIVGDRIADELISDEAPLLCLGSLCITYYETYETIPA